ncbi:MAG: ArdC family protein [Acidobacteria bacterium]|nr:ArdC family protein [Acidobacteriota bacterium]
MNKAFEIITETIIEKLEQGCVPWHQPWSSEAAKNLISKREYRGINVFLLGVSRYANPYWLTFRQAKQLGGHVVSDTLPCVVGQRLANILPVADVSPIFSFACSFLAQRYFALEDEVMLVADELVVPV